MGGIGAQVGLVTCWVSLLLDVSARDVLVSASASGQEFMGNRAFEVWVPAGPPADAPFKIIGSEFSQVLEVDVAPGMTEINKGSEESLQKHQCSSIYESWTTVHLFAISATWLDAVRDVWDCHGSFFVQHA